MDVGTVGGIIGRVIGLAGGAVGTYHSQGAKTNRNSTSKELPDHIHHIILLFVSQLRINW